MCGIAGFHSCQSDLVHSADVLLMTQVLRHRGPDHSALFADGPVCLGYTRLKIVDLSDAGNQPMTDDSGDYVIVYNGEVYNFQELRDELELGGVRFRSTTDTEVVVNQFARYGIEGIKRLNGMFAAAIWKKSTRELWLLRDPLGIKPLYYRADNQGLVFASEMKAILAISDQPPEIDREGLLNYLSYGHSISPTTMLRGICKLRPGHYLHVRNGQVENKRYFEYPCGTEDNGSRTEESWTEEAKEILAAATKRHLIADVPVGVFLSGGIDSALVTAFAVEHSAHLRTFTVAFPSNPGYDESFAASEVARFFGTDHSVLRINERDIFDCFDTLVYHYDEPFNDAAAFPTYLVSKFAREAVTVVLTGEGGDEVFGGYRRYLAERAGRFCSRFPSPIHNAFIHAADCFGRARRLRRMAHSLAIRDDAERYASWLEVFSKDAVIDLVEGSGIDTDGFDPSNVYRELFNKCPHASSVSRACYADAQTWLPDTYLEKVDKATMAVSLEARVPFLDLELVNFAARCPSQLKIRRLTTKYILRKVAAGMLPKSVINRPKHGFSVPTDAWFRGPLKKFLRDVLLDSVMVRRGFLNAHAIESLLRRHLEGKENCERPLWTLLMLELWMRQAFDGQKCPRGELGGILQIGVQGEVRVCR